MAAPTTPEFKTAHSILESIDPAVDAAVRAGTRSVKAGRQGFIRAYATARNESVASTIARALHAGVTRQLGKDQDLVPSGFSSIKMAPSTTEISECIRRVTDRQPVLLVIDEFGKNLEYFATSGSEGDPFLLQELAEMTQGADAVPLVIITMQHLSFDEYVQDSSTARRREWSKVQGRFQDIPYVETPAQSRRLIARALDQDAVLRRAADDWLSDNRAALETHGLRDIADDAAPAMPLHPLALAVLPELCSRYGQNERTLFSFVTGAEPTALPRYLASTEWNRGKPLPLVGLDRLYDYFLESSSSMIGVADGVSRWMEIETRIRDSAGLNADQLKTLKTIGLLNLISSGGRVRASRPLIELALTPEVGGKDEVERVLSSLVESGLITYRAFSDEYRIWQGSDYNLRRVIDGSRQEFQRASLADLLREAVILEPLVAGRHSQRTGVLRVFGRRFIDTPTLEELDAVDPAWDGVVYYVADPNTDLESLPTPDDGRPAVYVVPADIITARDAAIEAAALQSALKRAEVEGADWVAQRELVERASDAQQRLQAVIGETWDSKAEWVLAGSTAILDARLGLSSLLSDVSDQAYSRTPRVANEMIARRELTSQGAKARRFLTDALLAHPDTEAFGIDGYGPERAVYEAVFRKTGIHRRDEKGMWTLQAPNDRIWKPAWSAMNAAFDSASDGRVNLVEVRDRLVLPPIGLKDGIIPLLLIASLTQRSDEIALYEHGSLVLALDDAVAERLTKNLGHFSIKNTQTRGAKRAVVIESLVEKLGISTRGHAAAPTFLNVATALFRELRVLPPFAQKTIHNLSSEAVAVRAAFHQASEPDVLLFQTLPSIFGMDPFHGRGKADRQAADQFAGSLASAIRELRSAYPDLLNSVRERLAQATSTRGDLAGVRSALAADAMRLDGHVLEPRLRAFVGALARPNDVVDNQSWLENVAMVVCEGQAPRVWTDDMANRFPMRVAELGGALRRTLALLHERLASNVEFGYSVSRMTLTRPDGTESIELLSLTEHEKAAIDGPFEKLLDALVKSGVSRSAACRMLMARLAAEQEVAQDSTRVTEIPSREEQRYG